MPVVESPFGDGGLEPIKRSTGCFVERVVVGAAGVGPEPEHVREMHSGVLTPFICGAEFRIRLRFELLDGLNQKRFQCMGAVE